MTGNQQLLSAYISSDCEAIKYFNVKCAFTSSMITFLKGTVFLRLLLNYCTTTKHKMSFRTVSAPNASACHSHQEQPQITQINEILFWTTVAISALIAVFGVITNTLVIYFANQENSTTTLRYLNTVVKHLAISDLLYGVLGHPGLITLWRMGKM